ncbi:MAG: tail tape measure protein [Candidatus Andeanibacterium colombiense]|uniref:Tail tape measure protein n=1 Tax=Candidatus Andeanibacterium colombiense TaxID=3121345 RepID=A0AAJ6BNH1_9SPHN|nr:MAG: tail tape measure protein [Sphingomonadaceae bacterium]
MDDDIDGLLIEVRANTQGFQSDIAELRGNFDSTLVSGFEQAGTVLERGLLGAIRRGSLGFDDLKRAGLSALDAIAAQAVQAEIGSLTGGGSGGGLLGSLIGGLFGLPGRATGGPVSPGAAYMVGERGPEVFVPTSAGRVETQVPGKHRDVRVAIQLAAPRGAEAPVALRRSARQVASSVRRVLEG